LSSGTGVGRHNDHCVEARQGYVERRRLWGAFEFFGDFEYLPVYFMGESVFDASQELNQCVTGQNPGIVVKIVVGKDIQPLKKQLLTRGLNLGDTFEGLLSKPPVPLVSKDPYQAGLAIR